jgi:adenylate cyclase
MNHRVRQIWGSLAVVVGIAIVVGSIGGLALAMANSTRLDGGLLRGALCGLFAGFFIASGEVALDRSRALRRIRRMPLGIVLGMRIVLYTVGMTICFPLARGIATRILYGEGPLFRVDGQFWAAMVVGALLAVLLALAQKLSPLVGYRRMFRILIGVYQRPRKVEKVVVFMDLVGSTGLAEIIGDRAFLRFLNDAILEMTEPIVRHQGEIYRYAGDSILLVWNAGHELDAIRCVFDIEEKLIENRRRFERRYNTIPRYRVGIHKGPMVVGELGDMHVEVAILGDTINTAQRIEDLCRQQDYNVLASEEVLAGVEFPDNIEAHPLDDVNLRGKARKIKLSGLRRIRD